MRIVHIQRPFTAARAVARGLRRWASIFGPAWDGARRRLLFRHYWSYLTHPPTPASVTARECGGAADHEAQRRYVSAFLARLDELQGGAKRSREVSLTFRPIGKNLRLLGTALRANARRGCGTTIQPDGPLMERQMLKSRGQAWSPWLWARGSFAAGQPADDCAVAWSRLFRWPVATVASGGRWPEPPPLPARLGPYSRRELARLLEVAAATRYACTPVPSLARELDAACDAIGWPAAPTRVLGVHLRRGDAAAASADGAVPAAATRRSFSLDDYLAEVDAICLATGITHVFMATESDDELALARRRRPQYRVLAHRHDRSVFPDLRVSKQFIEDLALDRPDLVPHLVRSALADLRAFGRCHAFVGAFNSEFSMLSWLLAIGTRGHLVPYVSLSEPARWPQPDFQNALLNVRNNCPLELYHW